MTHMLETVEDSNVVIITMLNDVKENMLEFKEKRESQQKNRNHKNRTI